MEATIVLDSGTDAITFTATDVANGWIYDNETLSGWLKLPEVNAKLNERPNAHGTYSPDQLFTSEARVPFVGQYYGATPLAAMLARDRLSAMFNDGKAVMMTATDDIGATSRVGFIVALEPEYMHDAHFGFTFELAAPDPRRYGDLETVSTGLATPPSGLVWPLFSTAGGTLDWGTPGPTGRVAFTNAGNTTTYPVIFVGAGGSLTDGFSVTEVQTGRTITYPKPTLGGSVRIDSRTHRVTINGGDVTGDLTRREWFAIPRGASYEYQLTNLGGSTGSPLIELLAARAYL